MGEPDPVHLAEGVTVADAFVNFSLNYSNTPELYVLTNDSIPASSWEPIEQAVGDEPWIVENEYGLFRGFADEPQHPPADEKPRTQTLTLQHAEVGEVERVPMYDHVVTLEQNGLEPASAFGVHYLRGPKGGSTTITTRVEVAHDIVTRYVNGPLGSDTTPYWYWYRENRGGWRRGPTDRADYEGYKHADVRLVRSGSHTWAPKRVRDITNDDTVFEGDADG